MSTIEKALAKQKSKAQVEATSEQSAEVINKSVQATVEKTTAAETFTQSVTSSASKDGQFNQDILHIDTEDLTNRGYLIDNGTRNSIKDEFRQIKRKLLNNAFGKAAKTLNNPNLIMVSSSKPHEGKTFVSINLALSVAHEQDKTVLLIDADVLRPSITRELGLPESKGLIEYLLGETDDVGDIIYNTNIDKLKIVPAGEPHHLSNELLSSDKMAALAKELAERYSDRVVIFDCPPLVGVSETMVLANLMGQAIVVVEESKTAIADVQKATEALNENLAVGLVVNKAIRTHKDMYGYYGYGYES
jgi:receptor protein-tyrosine kinase